MKTKSAIKRLCKSCKIVKRRGRNFVICKKNPRHKQRQGFHTTTGAALVGSNGFNITQQSTYPSFEFSDCNAINVVDMNVSNNMITTPPHIATTNFCVYGVWLPVTNTM